MENELTQEIIKHIKEKRELKNLDDSYILELLVKYGTSIDFSKYASFKQIKRSKAYDELVTRIRKELREKYGLFVVKPLSKKTKLENIQPILQSHRSTNEREAYYDTVYKDLFTILEDLGLPQDYSLLDLACGYNPFSYSYLPRKPCESIVCDLSSADMSIIQLYFEQEKFPGQAIAFDLLSEKFKSWISSKSFDLCFLFKALDSLEMVQRHSSKKLLADLPAKFIVVSFALQSIGGNKSIAPSRRSWFEQFVSKQNWEMKTLELPNELFYVLRK